MPLLLVIYGAEAKMYTCVQFPYLKGLMMYLKLLLIILGLSFVVSEDCTSLKSCNTCISSSLHCIWCTDPRKPDDNRPRCESRDKFNDKSWCSDPDNPQTEKADIPDYNKKEQLRPPLANIKARPGDTVSFRMVYRPEKDYPVDIYYLFDNSYTMKKYMTELQEEASNIYGALSNISNNVRFGVGSFVEKPKEPFTSANPDDVVDTFNNHLSLTNDTGIFVEAVKAVKSGANLDNPEASLDALMQILACDNEIKWRPSARRIVILLTDDTYHSAGDGRAVGAYLPNDMKCHLISATSDSTSHRYPKEASLQFDYPSVSQISHMAKTKGISIFFTATKNVEAEYKALAEAVQGSKYIELKSKIKGESSTLVETIVNEYKELSQNLQIPRPKVPPYLELKLSPDCEKDRDCTIPNKGEIEINVSLTVKSCPSGNDNTDKLIISPNGMTDKLNITVHVLCQCDCETKKVENSPICQPDNATASRGAFQCGECKCYDNWYGKNCSCEGTSTEEEDLRKCKISEKDKEPCSGKGTCRCGECILCWNGYGGPQCQYRTDKCPVFGDKVCADHGECKEEKCKCKPGWKGDSCSCPTSTDMCVGGNTEVCSGRGECKCGVCACTDSNKYSGLYCDQCDDTCVEERCQQLNDYVICIYDGEKTDKQTCDKKTKLKSNIIEVEVKNQTEINAWGDANYCEKVIDDGSIIIYKYYDGNNFTKIWIQNEKKLPPETNIWIPIGGVVGGILLIGILTLITWKILVDSMDAREYRKFAENAEREGYEVMDNPLYKPAAVSINNPAYTNG